MADSEVRVIVHQHLLFDAPRVTDIRTYYLHYLQQVLQLDALETHLKDYYYKALIVNFIIF
jgi:hypothetical protein